MNDKELMIKKILSNTFIDIRDISEEEIISFNLYDKLYQLGIVNSADWIDVTNNNITRIKHNMHNIPYQAYIIMDTLRLVYQYKGEFRELKEKYNLINFKMIDKLIDYKNNKIEVKDLISFITNK